MAMDQQQRRLRGIRLALIAKTGGDVHRLNPRAGEPIWVNEVFLVDPADAGQGAVDARVEIGTRDLLLATLSAKAPRAALEPPVLLDEEFCFYVTPQGGDIDSDSDSDAEVDSDADTDAEDGVAVYFNCVALTPSSGDTEEENEDEDQAVSSSEDDDDEIHEEEESKGNDTEDVDDDAMSSECQDTASSSDEEVESRDDDDEIYEDDEESSDDINRDIVRESSASDNPKYVQNFGQVAARAFLFLFLFNYIIAFFRMLM